MRLSIRDIQTSAACQFYQRKTLFLVSVIGLICTICSTGLASSSEVPFEWDPSFASPETSLSIQVLQTLSSPPNGAVVISVHSTGFLDPTARAVLWQKTASQYDKHTPAVLEDGTVQLIPGVDAMMLDGYIRGQALDMALVDETTGRRAHFKLVPFPVAAEAPGGCTASAEIQTKSGLEWVITLAGYDAQERVGITSVAKKETITNEVIASDTGGVSFPILYPKRSRGNARVTAEGASGCKVDLEFAIGKSALKAK